MAEYNITMNQLNTQGTYDTLNPTTKAGNVSNVTSASDYGLGTNASVDDILALLKNSVQSSGNSLTLPDGTNVINQIENVLGIDNIVSELNGKANIESGSYVGDDRNVVSIAFNSQPKIIVVVGDPVNGEYQDKYISIIGRKESIVMGYANASFQLNGSYSNFLSGSFDLARNILTLSSNNRVSAGCIQGTTYYYYGIS